MFRVHILAFAAITFMVSALRNQPDVEEGLPFTEVETIPVSADSLGMTLAWGTKLLTFKDKDQYGKEIVGKAEVLSIATTLTGDLVEGGLYFTHVMLDKEWKVNKYDSYICGTKWKKG